MNIYVNSSLSQRLYSAGQVREIEPLVAKKANLEMMELMERAGTALFEAIQLHFSDVAAIAVVCGKGNNGGDGYVVARLAKLAGYKVAVYQIGDGEKLLGDALTARKRWTGADGEILDSNDFDPNQFELVVDALLGTGLKGAVTDPIKSLIERINKSSAKVLSADIPSGLCADTGSVLAVAVEADITVTFVTVKQGLVTGQSRDYCGTLLLNDLAIAEQFDELCCSSYSSISIPSYRTAIGQRKQSSHKTMHGKVVCIGGYLGMAGAIRMAAEASLRAGCGMVKVITHPHNTALVATGRHELMVLGIKSDETKAIQAALDWADVILIGPGLGQEQWGKDLLHLVLEQQQDKPMVVDADALNLIAQGLKSRVNWILTPHSGEAARLLQNTPAAIEADRYKSVLALQQAYGGVCILKGAGSLVTDGKQIEVCLAGNPGMATAGMGDVLSGVVAAMLAQGLHPLEAAKTAVNLHAQAGDIAAQQGESGMLASDLFPLIRRLINE